MSTFSYKGGFLVRVSPHTGSLVISVKTYSEEAGQYRLVIRSIQVGHLVNTGWSFGQYRFFSDHLFKGMMFYWFHFLNISLIFLIRFRHYPVAQNIEEVWKIKSNDTEDIFPKKTS